MVLLTRGAYAARCVVTAYSSSSASKSMMKTRCEAGSETRWCAVQRPMPRAPPVMMMFLLSVDGMVYVGMCWPHVAKHCLLV